MFDTPSELPGISQQLRIEYGKNPFINCLMHYYAMYVHYFIPRKQKMQ